LTKDYFFAGPPDLIGSFSVQGLRIKTSASVAATVLAASLLCKAQGLSQPFI
jgi:hypothetical protein